MEAFSGQNILDAATQIGIIVTDLDGKITVFNSGAESLLGFRPNEVLGKTPLMFHSPDEITAHEKLLSISLGKTVQGFEIFKEPILNGVYQTQRWTYLDKNKHPFKVQISITPMSDSQNKLNFLLFMVTALTRPKSILPELNTEVGYITIGDLPNKQQFTQIVDTELRRMKREHHPISVMLVNVDCFKNFIETYSLEKAENCLQKIAYALSNRIKRAGDFFAYYGEDQFAVLLPNADEGHAVKFSELLRLMIQELQIEHINSTAGPYMTVRIGIATIIPDKGSSAALLLSKAQLALQQAKESGGNCSRLAD